MIPSLERFEKEVARFEHLKQEKHDLLHFCFPATTHKPKELSMKKTPTDIHWLRIDAQPVKATC